MVKTSLVLAYIVAVLSPAALAVISDNGFGGFSLSAFADLCALAATAILAMQYVLSARLHWIERRFGLDRVMLFHRAMAIAAFSLLALHPLLLAADSYGWSLLFSVSGGWKVLTGKLALAALAVTAATSLLRRVFAMKYEAWLGLHNILALLVLAGGLVHGWAMDVHVAGTALRFLWTGFAVVAMAMHAYKRLVRPALLRKNAFTVADVRQETHNVWTLSMTPPPGKKAPRFLPGQFHFLTLLRKGEKRPQEHPFTISSSPENRDAVESSIKASGDYTATIGKTRPGDRAILDGPYGWFSYLLRPQEKKLAFIAGGIGITPFMSMIRSMRDRNEAMDVVLFYANRTEKDIAFRQELEQIAAAGVPRLTLVLLLNAPSDAWTGEQGRVTVDRIKKECGKLDQWAFYLCGPSPMMMSLARDLRIAGVSKAKVRFERFSI